MAADLLSGSRSVCGCDRADPVSMENQPGSFGSARSMQGYTDLLKEKYYVIAVTLDGCAGYHSFGYNRKA